MNVVIPMAGRGQRFIDQGVTTPKPFIDIRGKTMIEVSVENLGLDCPHVFIARAEHLKIPQYVAVMNKILASKPRSVIITTDGVTEGPAATCLLAKKHINNNDPLLYANCDQYIEWNPKQFLWEVEDFDGGLLMYRDKSLCGSFALMDESCYVKETREKEVISDVSSTGIYYWSRGSDFVKYAERMIANNGRAKNGEFYAINVYNEGIKDGQKYVVSFIKRFWRLGVPAELEQYLKDNPPQ